MFWLDLDELDELSRKHRLISRNAFNVFSFNDRHYARFSGERGVDVKTRVIERLAQNGIDASGCRIMLLTHLQTLGYIFNPVSFYICFDASNKPRYAVAEVTNTFSEMKQFVLDESAFSKGVFDLRILKNFYVSPFSEPDDVFNFIIRVPSDELHIRVDDYKNDERVLLSALTGKRKSLGDWRLLYYTLRFPLITLRIISLIHWQAFLLLIKRIPFFKKSYQSTLQKEMVKL